MTQRSKADLAILYADNSSGDISPADLRDFVESVDPCHGSFYITAPIATTPSLAGVYLKVAGTTTAVGNQTLFTHSNGRLTYIGAKTVHCDTAVSLSLAVAGNNKIISFALAVNGVPLDYTSMENKIANSTDVKALSMRGDFDLAPGDYIEVWAANVTDTTEFTALKLYVSADGSIL